MAVQPLIPASIAPVTDIVQTTARAFVILITRVLRASCSSVRANAVLNWAADVAMGKSKDTFSIAGTPLQYWATFKYAFGSVFI